MAFSVSLKITHVSKLQQVDTNSAPLNSGALSVAPLHHQTTKLISESYRSDQTTIRFPASSSHCGVPVSWKNSPMIVFKLLHILNKTCSFCKIHEKELLCFSLRKHYKTDFNQPGSSCFNPHYCYVRGQTLYCYH